MECFELARKWRDTCQEEHGNSCLQEMRHSLPTRVIDVGPADGSREPYLRITNHEEGEWVALSHCWGRNSQFVTDSSNILNRQRSILMEDMPPTFLDAVIVTRKLGYRYLWIDSLCIIQKDHEDWAAESIRMRDYYKHSSITISADSASGDETGFLKQPRDIPESFEIMLKTDDEIGIRKPTQCPTFRYRDTCVSKRAWTLQEFILAPRSLLYTSSQLVWECQSRKYCESDDNSQDSDENELYYGTKRFFITPSTKWGQPPELQKYFEPSFRWYCLVNDYFFRDITYETDILPAISGLAREIQLQTGHTYAAGIWIEEICKGLLWQAYGGGRMPEAYRAPSWSWASLKSSPEGCASRNYIDFYLHLGFLRPEVEERRASLISYELIPKDSDPFGCVSSGYISIRGRTLLASNWKGKAEPCFNSYEGSFISHYFTDSMSELMPKSLDQLVYYFDILEEEISFKNSLQNVTMFQISSWIWNEDIVITMALLLVQVTDHPKKTYRRVGIAEVPNVDGLAEEGWDIQEVCII
ncbi:HET-domain-containing protein [Hyaloscypha variabilis F]|uniref:HET-domain-containing protein n=1 Tax=Hyaloscypha variabilis (strain UAMH 11265 / GT02V1 / F) TaxID=1149755 RepID=A0A2J6R971_HYAVF|nr:HET-domain-containing protein [Hyaloscypha variabilis F]